jgi:hypothetical protein
MSKLDKDTLRELNEQEDELRAQATANHRTRVKTLSVLLDEHLEDHPDVLEF